MLEKRGVIMRDLVWSLVRRSTRAFWILCKVMVPVMILVQVGVQLGAVEVLAALGTARGDLLFALLKVL